MILANFGWDDPEWDANWINDSLDLFEDENDRPALGNDAWESIRKLLLATYWSRAWIIQECVLARITIVACGLMSVSFRHLTPLVH